MIKQLILILAMCLLAGCTITGGVVTDPCTLNPDSCYFDNLDCELIENEQLKQSCISELAIQNQDLLMCEVLESQSKGYCQEKIAESLNDMSVCQNIDDDYWADNCYFHFATTEGNADHCSFLLEAERIQECYKEIAYEFNDAELCGRLDKVTSQKCLYSIAKETKDPSICNMMESTLNVDTCKINLAKITENPELCQEITFKLIREDCEAKFE